MTYIQRHEGKVMVEKFPVGHVKDGEERRFPVWLDIVDPQTNEAGVGKGSPFLSCREGKHSCSGEKKQIVCIYVKYHTCDNKLR